MVRSNQTLLIFFGIFIAAGVTALIMEYLFHLTDGDRPFYFIHHYLFGLGGPFFFAPFHGTRGSRFLEPTFLPSLAMFLRRHGYKKLVGKGFWVGVFLCQGGSIANELVVYWVLNPRHGADWGHWASDLAGMLTAYLIYCQLLTLEARQMARHLELAGEQRTLGLIRQL